MTAINTNGFFGNIQGPFLANEDIFLKIQENCKDEIDYLSKIGIHYVGNYDLDIKRDQIFIMINNIEFQLGKTRMLELEDVKIKSIYFVNNIDSSMYIDYQYHKLN